MPENNANPQKADLQQIIDSAKRLGVELDEEEALQWLTAVALAQDEDDISVDIKSGVFGHKISMLDFSDAELAHFRKIGMLVGFDDIPGVVETALALSGSAAQSKIQRFPGDADYFERVNIRAESKERACQILADVMQEKVKATLQSPTFQMIEIKMGSYPQDVKIKDTVHQKGAPISWKPQEVLAGQKEVSTPEGDPSIISWQATANDPGWCKLDWVVAHPVHKRLVNASNMLDVTWEAPDGSITPLDGYLDPCFQQTGQACFGGCLG